MNRIIIRRTSGWARLRYIRGNMTKRTQESRTRDNLPVTFDLGLTEAETFPAEKSAGNKFVRLYIIALVKKGMRKHPPRGDAL